MSRYLSGRLVAVDQRRLGRRLAADHAAGVSTLTVISTVVFDEDGGSLQVNGQVIGYTGLNEETGELFLSGPLEAAADEGDRVLVFDELYQRPAVTMTAQVDLDEDDDADEPVEATVAHHLQKEVPPGLRGGATPAESVLLDYDEDDDEWRVIDILGLDGRNGTGTQFEDRDTFTVETAGAQTFTLSHEPIDGSLHVILFDGWMTLKRGDFTVSGKTVSIPDPLALIDVSDVIDFKYAYRAAGAPPSAPTGVPWEATGWRYLQVAQADAVDRSAVAFDDSTWAVGQASFGDVSEGVPVAGWPAPRTDWQIISALWIRRVVAATPGSTVTVTVRVDNAAKVYWNGSLITDTGDVVAQRGPFIIPAANVLASNVLAIRGHDSGPSTPNNTYLDAEVTVD